MSDTAIKVQNLSKRYRIGAKEEKHETMMGSLIDMFKMPVRNLRKVRSLTQFDGDKEEEDIIWALRDVSFEVKRGEVVGIIGRNGAGKSTLLKILSRITPPTSGNVELRGRVSSLLEVGTGFHRELTGRENIYLNGAILGMTKKEIDKKFDEIVDFSGVEKFIDTPVKRYSSGMKVRLAFSVAAHLEPEILLIDEVLAVGDVEFQKKCLGKMENVAREGRTVLFVSHNMGAIRSLCQWGILLEMGEVVEFDNILTVSNKYLNYGINSNMSVINIAGVKRQNEKYGNIFRLIEINLNEDKTIKHSEPFKIIIKYIAYRDIENVAIGIGINNIDGGRIVSFDSDLMEESRKIYANKNGIVEMNIDTFYLQPGKYLLDVGARSGIRGTIDFVQHCSFLDILPGSKTPPQIIVPGKGNGGLRFPARWTWK